MDRYGYTYDRNSNRLTRSNALAAAFSETYSYDALNQLQSFARTGGTTTSQQWQFDALGNWTTVTTNGVAQSRIANAQNELTQVGGSSLAYSSTGNLTADAQGRTLGYDAWNRLVSVKSASGTEVARYGYDGLNRRIVEQVGTLAFPAAATAAIRDVYYSQDWQALEERVRTSPSQVAATADTRFIWSPVYVDAMVARDRNADGNTTTGTGGLEQRVYAIQDANWNTTAIIAATGVPGVAAGTVINRFAYTPYGEVQTLTASWAPPPAGSTPAAPWAHLFQGLEFTDVTALAYVRHRDYSASLGRFIELDPIGFDAGDNNWYRFVANGPTGKTDPSGLWYVDHRPYAVDGGGAAASNCSPQTSGSAALDAVQAGLDLFGLVPGVGEVFDGLNGLISLGRGDYTGAGLSFAAMVPVGGQAATAAKFGLKYGDEVAAAGRCAATKGAAQTPVSQGAGRAAKKGTPNSIYEQVDGAGNVRSRTFYDENGRSFARQDFDHAHGGLQPHEHLRNFDSHGRPISSEKVRRVPSGYDNSPSK
jgi:RHS repeat-associated protein